MKACDYLEKELGIIAEILAEEDVIYDSEDHDIDLEEEVQSVYGIMKVRVKRLFYSFVKKNKYVFAEVTDFEKKILILLFRTKFFSLRRKKFLQNNHTDCKQTVSIDAFKKNILKERVVLRKKDFKITEPQNPIILISHCLEKEVCDFFQQQLRKIGIEKIFVAGGGTEVFQIIEQEKPDFVLGVACIKEVEDALEQIEVPALGICIDVRGRCSQKRNLI